MRKLQIDIISSFAAR